MLEKTSRKDSETLEEMVSAKYGVHIIEKFQALFICHQSGIVTVGLDNLKGLFQPKWFYDLIRVDPDRGRKGKNLYDLKVLSSVHENQ